MITTYYSQALDRYVTIPDGTVAPCDACPNCGENAEDWLIWQPDDTLYCATCGVRYAPDAGGQRLAVNRRASFRHPSLPRPSDPALPSGDPAR